MHFTPPAIALAAAAAINLLLAIHIWQRRRVPGGMWLALLTLVIAEWSLTGALEMAAFGIPAKILISKFQYVGAAFAPPLWFRYVQGYTRRKPLPGGYRRLLWIIPVLILALAATNEWHRLIWTRVVPSSSEPGAPAVYEHGAAVWLAVAYAYFIMLLATVRLLRVALRGPVLYRRQAFLLTLAAVVPWIGNILYVTGLNPFSGVDLTPFGFTITGLILTWCTLQFRLLDMVPVAHDTLFESMSDGVLVLDPQDRILNINPAAGKLLGLTPVAVGNPAGEALKDWPALISALQSGIPAQAEVEKPGSGSSPSRHFDVRASPLFDRQKRLGGRLVVLRDITARKRTDEQLVAYQRDLEEQVGQRTRELHKVREALMLHEKLVMLGRVAGSVAHEIRSPLSAIRNAAYLIRMAQEAGGPEKAVRHLDIIDRQVDQADQTIRALLEFSKGRQVECRDVPASEIVDAVLADLKLPGKVRVERVVPAEPLHAFVDPVQVRMAISNLTRNAIQAMPDGGTLRIEVAGQESGDRGQVSGPIPDPRPPTPDSEPAVIIRVADTGVGIPSDRLDRVFEPLFTTKQTGFGIGLAITRSMVEANRGTIVVDSQVGKGTVFTIRLPAEPPPDSGDSPGPA